jgi:beta-lactamase superfamily II metal-dependent hydrolase
MSVVNILAAIPYAAISVKTLPWLYVFLYYLFFIILPHKDIDIEIKKISMKASLLIVLSVWTIIHVTYPSKPALYCPAGRGINAAFMQTKDNKKILVLGCDSERSPQAVKGSIVPFLKYLGINNIDTLILYSVNEAGNLEALKRAFVIKSVYSDTDVKEYFKQAEIIQGGFYLKEGGETFINLSPIAADITSGNNEFIFAKITDDKLYKRTGDIIYLCQYNEESALRMAKENRCVVNSSNSGFFRKPKPLIDKNISDAGEKLFYYALN